VTLRLGPGMAAVVSETLEASDELGSTGSVVVLSAVRAAGDSVDVHLRYPAIALTDQPLELPSLNLRLSASDEADPRRLLTSGGDRSGAEGGEANVELRLGMLDVAPHDSAAAFPPLPQPRPTAPVLGGRWNVWHLLVLATLLAGSGLTARVMRRTRAETFNEDTGLDRAAALREMDRLRGGGWIEQGRMPEFYTAMTEVLRRFARGSEARWVPGLTATELCELLEGEGLPPIPALLRRTVDRAEQVRFGGRVSTPEDALEDWTTLRDWIARAPTER
jgi:hypothetical protein